MFEVRLAERKRLLFAGLKASASTVSSRKIVREQSRLEQRMQQVRKRQLPHRAILQRTGVYAYIVGLVGQQ